MMIQNSILLDLAVIIVAAEIGSVIFTKLKLSPILGMLVAGIVIGPFSPGFSVDPSRVSDIAQLGAVLLMFGIGLNLDTSLLKEVRFTSIGIALAGSLISFVLGWGVGLAWGLGGIASAFLGVMVMSTSSTMSLKLMEDSFIKYNRPVASVIGGVVLDDIFGLMGMTLVASIFLSREVSMVTLLTGAGLILVMILLIILLGRQAIPRVLSFTERFSPGSELMLAIAICFFLAYVSTLVELSPYIGAFFAGSIIASTRYAKEVSSYIKPTRTLFSGVFFAAIGMLIDPTHIPLILPISLAISAVAIIGKLVGGLSILSVRRVFSIKTTILVSAFLIPRGEVALIVAGYGVAIGACPPEFLSIGGLIMIITTLATIFIVRMMKPEKIFA